MSIFNELFDEFFDEFFDQQSFYLFISAINECRRLLSKALKVSLPLSQLFSQLHLIDQVVKALKILSEPWIKSDDVY